MNSGTIHIVGNQPPVSSPGERRKPFLEFKHVFISFATNEVLNDVSFAIMPAETVCILGRSGVGKSVCLRLFMGFLKPDAGRIVAAYEDTTDYPESELERVRKKVTMVFQNGALFDSLTVGENVAFPLRERGDVGEREISQIVDGLLEMVRVKPMRDLLSSELSTGMKRSVAIARALATQPEAILYDEPTTMVDPLMARHLGDLIKRLNSELKLTTVVVTHDTRLAEKLAHRVVFLDHANVVFDGSTAAMERSAEPVVQQFLQLDRIDFRALLAAMKPQPRRLTG